MTISRRPTGWPGALALALGGLLAAAHGAAARPDAVVVVLYPDSSNGSPGSVLVDKGIRSTFAAAPGERVEILNEHLEVSRFADDARQQLLAEHLGRKYAGRKVDLVIAGLSSGLDFVLKHRAAVFPGVPVVFCGVEQGEVQARRLPLDVMGVPVRFDISATLDLALRLHPKTSRVYVVAGKSRFDAAWEAKAREVFRAYDGKLEFVYLSGLPMEELAARVAHLPPGSILYYLNIFEDGGGRVQFPAEALGRLAAVANAPIYGHVDTFVGRGLVGGRVFRFERAGQDAAGVGLRLLGGERPEAIGIGKPSEPSHEFDWRQLQRWGIPEGDLPPGSVVRFKRLTFWDTYKWHLIGAASVCLVQTLLIVGLLVQRASRRRAEARARQVIEAAPSGMVMVGADGLIVLVNAEMEKLFGYAKGEMLSQPIEILLPERYRGEHVGHRARFSASPETRPMGAGRTLFGRRKDGSKFPVEVGLSPVRADGGLFTLASVIDVSERHRTETELRVLTGRLLEAQEVERRRIARELHDDFNQSLALLAVELDLLGQAPPPEGIGPRMRELSAQVRQISTSAHELSHQLHPSKLERLGLVAALRGLCKDPLHAQELSIRFMYDEVPEPLPEAVALCVYRIAQEALRNVLRHSGATCCEVELGWRGGAVCLGVVDDGTGFDPRGAAGTGGLGLVSMKERLRLVGGELVLDTRPGGGTRIEVRVPVAALGVGK